MSDMSDSNFGTTLIPDTTTLGSQRKLSKGSIVAISIVVILVLAGIVVGILFATVWKKQSPSRGSNQYGSITVEDEATRVQTPPYRPGDTLLAKYKPTPAGFNNTVKWSFSSNNGRTWIEVIPVTPGGNSAKYTLPEATFSDRCLFRAENTTMSTEFVTTDFFSVEPLFGITKGAGTEANDKVYTGSAFPIVITLQLDTSLPDLEQITDWSVTTSADKTKFPSTANQTVTAVTLDKTKNTAQLTWTASKEQMNVYYQVKTTSLPLTQYPRQLSAVSPFAIDILSSRPSGPTPCGGSASTFKMCSVIMVDSQGKSNRFMPGETVLLQFQHNATFSGTATWAYSVSGGSPVTFTPTSGPTQPSSNVVTYTWIIVDTIATDSFVVTVTSEGDSAVSPNYSVKSSFTWDAPNTGHSVLVAKTQSLLPKAPLVHWLTTTVTFDAPVATDFPDWSVSLGSLAGTFTTLTDRIYSASLVSGSTTQRALVWYLEPDDFKAHGMDVFVRFTAQNATKTETLIVTSSETVAFTLTDFAPITAPTNLGTKACNASMDLNNFVLQTSCPESKIQSSFFYVKDVKSGPLVGYICYFDATQPNNTVPITWFLFDTSSVGDSEMYEGSPLLYALGHDKYVTFINQGSNLWSLYSTLSDVSNSKCASWPLTSGSPTNGDPINGSAADTSGPTPTCPSTTALNTQFLWAAEVF